MGWNRPERGSRGTHGESGTTEGETAAGAVGTGGRQYTGRRRFIGGTLAFGAMPLGVRRVGAAQEASVDIDFVDCVTVELTGDLGAVTGLHFYVWNAVDVVDDHLLIEDLASLSPGTTLANGLRIRGYDPDAGVLTIALNTVAYNFLDAADVYLGGPPDFFGDGADVSERNPAEGHVALDDLAVDGGSHADGDVVTADATLVNVGDGQRSVFLGFSAVGPDGLAYTNGGTTGRTVTLAAGETATHTVEWEVEADAPDGDYAAHVAVWRESDPADLQVRYDERYVHGAFGVGETVAASIEGASLPSGTFATGEVVETDVTVRNAGTGQHTFFVGYSAIGPDGLAYTNDGTTGTPVTLAAGETGTTTVDWTVESDAPAGQYDVHVAVWAEDSPDVLETKLDEEIHDDAFEVA